MINSLKSGVLFTSILFIVACSKSPAINTINVSLTYQSENIQCNTQLEISKKTWLIEQFLIYFHAIEFQDQQGRWHPLALSQNKYQHENIVLLGETCDGEKLENWQIQLSEKVSVNQLSALRFQIGMPFEENHQNPLSQPSPISLPSMFWVWRTGHKFIRLELNNPDDYWLFHLGSTGCHAASAVRSPTEVCKNPNLISVSVPISTDKIRQTKNANEITLELALNKLLDSVEISGESQCQSEPDNPHCQQLFANLQAENLFISRVIRNDK